MAATTPRFDRMAPAAPDNVGALRRELRRWARRQGASPAIQANIALAFSEACTSILGPDVPREGIDGPLMLQAWRDRDRDGDEIGVQVSHGSRGGPPPVGVGYGFGLALMANVCDRFEVRRRDARPGTAVLMTFRLNSVPSPARSSRRPPFRSTTRR
jgi:anti-sigma regulatory factor (Ser/Thr protein kinase)